MNDLTLPKAPNYIHCLYLCFYEKNRLICFDTIPIRINFVNGIAARLYACCKISLNRAKYKINHPLFSCTTPHIDAHTYDRRHAQRHSSFGLTDKGLCQVSQTGEELIAQHRGCLSHRYRPSGHLQP